MRSAYDIIQEAMARLGVSKYRIAKAAGDDPTFVGRVIEGRRPMPDRLRLRIAEMLGLDAEDLRVRLLIEREGLDVAKVRAAVSEPPPLPDEGTTRSSGHDPADTGLAG